MNEIQGTYRDGRVELDSTVDWPEGIHVTVQAHIMNEEEPAGTRLPVVRLPDGTIMPWSATAEFREALLAQMDSREPVQLTPQEETEWKAARAWFKDYTLAAVQRDMELGQ